ncbi:MAG: GntR family transcriptional regulator [Spirochaetota bacterium]
MTSYRVEYEDLSQRVYRVLKERILKGDLRSGEKLLQDELAESLGVSRTPLLSALSKLEKEMLVETKPRRGAFVRQLTHEEFIHIYDIRLRLEPLGAAEAAQNATESDTAELVEITHNFDRLAQTDDEGGIKEGDYRFHMKIMEMSGNRLLYNIISSFNIILIANLEGLTKDPRISSRQHFDILEAIKRKDAKEAEAAMERHNAESRRLVIEKHLGID